nr:RHS repeat protein [Desulfobulbaceae bacterium]
MVKPSFNHSFKGKFPDDFKGCPAIHTYDGNHNLNLITDPFGKQTQNTYDAEFRLTDIIDPLTTKAQSNESPMTGKVGFFRLPA